MARVAGVNIPDKKKIEIALTYIYGIGRITAQRVLKEAGIDLNIRAADLKSEDLAKLKNIIESRHKIEGDLRRIVSMNIKNLKDIRCWRGMRHAKGLPVRGQTTRVNNRTVRGNTRRTMGSGKKKAPSPK